MNPELEIAIIDSVDSELLEAMERLVPQLSSTAAADAEQVRAVVASPCATLLVARNAERRIVGMLTLAIFPIPTGVRAWIEDVVVDSEARGAGVGAALTRRALEIAISRKARTVELTSNPKRVAANRLYQKLGFKARETNVYRYSP